MGDERHKPPPRGAFFILSSSRFLRFAQRPTEGFLYCPNILSGGEEDGLAREVANLPFKPFDFHGYLANRQVVSFGYRYDNDRGAVVEASPFPSFLVSLRNKVAAIFDRPAEDFRQVLINEYRPGA